MRENQMENIYQKAQREQAESVRQEILNKLETLPDDTPNWRDAAMNILDEIIQSEEQPTAKDKPLSKKDAWDFSAEKARTVFVEDDTVKLCPITLNDADFYRNIRMQYSLIYRSVYYNSKIKKENLFSDETLAPQVFYCVIRDTKENQPLGYLGIKDTSADLWEIAIELDGKYTSQGYGSRSIRLYLNEIRRITGKDTFRALIEADNIPSQKCFEKLGAQLVGLCSSAVLLTDDEKERFEARNLDLIGAHMIGLAERLKIEPRKLLSHVLDYRLTCPL
jgi:RimJ/RimL family protein N-acetyltransferase